jgi:ubiquinol-cytochrome c reductase cytochrome c subunit
MTAQSEARMRSRILRAGLLAAIAIQIAVSFRPTTGRAQTPPEAPGRDLYQANCSTCHGLSGLGTANGPSLVGVGPASVDFFLSTGRMPLATPDDQPERGRPAFDPDQITAIVAYVQTIAPGGEPIPAVDPGSGSLSEGAQTFLDNCAACHGAGATGDSVGGGQIAPSLSRASALQIAEAVRTGPGVMPPFNERTISGQELDSTIRYLLWLRDHGGGGGIQLGRVGAVAEGLIAGVIGLGILLIAIRLTGSRT